LWQLCHQSRLFRLRFNLLFLGETIMKSIRAGTLLLCAALTAFSVTTAKGDYVLNFSGLTFTNTLGSPGFQLQSHPGLVGTLTAVEADFVIDGGGGGIWANDLGVMISNQTSVSLAANGGVGIFQAGGNNQWGAAEHKVWGAGVGNSGAPGTPVVATVALDIPITFNGNAGDPNILLAHLWNSNSNGTWTGSITLVGVNAIPEPSAFLALAVCGGIGFLRRRRFV